MTTEVKPEVPAETVEAAPVEEVKAPVEPPKQPEAKVEKKEEEEKPAVQISMDSLKQPDPPAE